MSELNFSIDDVVIELRLILRAIEQTNQLLRAQEKLLKPAVEVKTATEGREKEQLLWIDPQVILNADKYNKIVEAFRSMREVDGLSVDDMTRAVFVGTVRDIIGDDVKVERMPEGEYPRPFSSGEKSDVEKTLERQRTPMYGERFGVPGVPHNKPGEPGKPGEVKRCAQQQRDTRR